MDCKNLFYCKSKRLANYLCKNGSKLLKIEEDPKIKGSSIFVFSNDSSIDINLDKFEKDKKRCLF